MDIIRGLLNVLLVLSSVFMICLVLIQRGKGGGLAGAFGGMGGSSAFGTKAGDVFTRVTIIVAGVWFLLNMLLVVLNNQKHTSAFDVPSAAAAPLDSAKDLDKAAPAADGTTPKAGSALPEPPAAPKNDALPSALEEEPAAATPPAETPATPPAEPSTSP